MFPVNSLIRVCCISNRVRSLRPDICLQSALEAIESVRSDCPDLIVLPAFALTGASCGSLSGNSALLDAARDALDELRLATADLPCYVIAGLLLDDWGKPAPVCAVLHSGQLVGFVPAEPGPSSRFDGRYSDRVLPAGTVFSAGNCRFTICSCPPDRLLLHTAELAATGCDLVVCPSCAPLYAGYVSEARRTARLVTKALGCAAALCNGGGGDTTSPWLFGGFAGVYECGEELRFAAQKNADCLSSVEAVGADIDLDIIAAQKPGGVYVKPFFSAGLSDGKKGILRRIPQNPFLTCPNRDAYVGELFALQVSALIGRLQNSGIQKMVLGVSGGLDSALALLVATRAADCLGLPREALCAVTMPGFGTTDRTLRNAKALMKELGCSCAEVSIREACTQHFRDIGQDPNSRDVTYENAQARERTQILFDIANQVGGLVIGTGDLSEAALGWCTFGGDQMAGYNVNICLTKNMIRAVVKYVADAGLVVQAAALAYGGAAAKAPGGPVAHILRDILATPVSPELLPAQPGGQIAQKTEEILGSYDLHDFFTYYFVKYGFRPAKLLRYACVAFGPQLEPAFIKEKLELFLRRFFAAQFKRSCSPDAASITEVNLLGQNFTIPSDGDCRALLAELEEMTV